MGIRLIIYLEDMLIMAESWDLSLEHTTIEVNLLSSLGFVLNKGKSILVPTQELEFLGFLVNSIKMSLYLPRDKLKSIKRECQVIMNNPSVSIRTLSWLLGKLSSSIQAVFPAPLYYRFLLMANTMALKRTQSYESTLSLNQAAQEELLWWRDHLAAWNGRSLLRKENDLLIETNASNLGWGACCNGVRTGRIWSRQECLQHKLSRLELMAGGFVLKSFFKNRASIQVKLLMDNTTAIAYINRMGGGLFPCASQSSFRDLAMVPPERDLPHSTSHPRHLQQCSRQGIQSRQRFIRLEIGLHSLCSPQWALGSLRGRFVRDTTYKSASQVCKLATGSRGRSDRRFCSGLVSDQGLCIPPFQSGRSLPIPSARTGYPISVSYRPSMGDTTLVPSSVTSQCRFCLPVPNRPMASQQGGDTTPSLPTSTSRVACLSQRYTSMGTSNQAEGLLVSAWRNQTSGSYESAWRLWCSWCCRQEIDPISASVQQVVNFLASLFADGKEYHMINVCRSALSMTLPKIEGLNVGQHPLVCQVIKGIFQKKLPLLRYSASWDVSKVLIFILVFRG